MTDGSKQGKIGWQAAVFYKQKYVDTNVGEYACMSSVKVLSNRTFKRAKHACCSKERRSLIFDFYDQF